MGVKYCASVIDLICTVCIERISFWNVTFFNESDQSVSLMYSLYIVLHLKGTQEENDI